MNVLIIIPARMNSTRLPEKPLRDLIGATGKSLSLIERCYQAAAQVSAAQIVVATDHEAIADHVHGFGGEVVMTPENCENGTERCAHVVQQNMPQNIDADLIVNFQGDAPLIPPDFVDALIAHMRTHPDADMATPVMPCDKDMLHALREDRRAGRVGGTTACFTQDHRALYFSKEVLPISDALVDEAPSAVHLHIGLYAYRPEALARYAHLPAGRLERIEGLEQLRFLENDMRVDCVPVDAKGRAFWEVNLPEDIARVEAALKQRGIE